MACIIPAPTYTAVTTARRRSWAVCPYSTRIWSTCRTGWSSSCASRAGTRSGSPTWSCSVTVTNWTSGTRLSSATFVSVIAAAGRRALQSRRFVSMADPHHAGIEWTLVPENWSGRVEVVTAIDGRVSNGGVARYRQLEGRHLNPVSPRTFGPEVIALKAETRQSNLYISQAARTRVFAGDQPLPVERTLYQMEDYIQQVLAFDVRQGAATRVEKMVTFYTSRDPAISDTLVKAATSAARHTDFAAYVRAPHRGVGRAVAGMRHAGIRKPARAAAAAAAHRAHPAGLLASHRRPRRRAARPRAQRRGLPRARVLGRDLRVPVLQCPAARGHARSC